MWKRCKCVKDPGNNIHHKDFLYDCNFSYGMVYVLPISSDKVFAFTQNDFYEYFDDEPEWEDITDEFELWKK